MRKMPAEFETSCSVENANRNRYVNILANEPTRVKLSNVPHGQSDYINANRVSGVNSHPGYIATQAPLPETMSHFWQMVHETSSPAIIMLTREQEAHSALAKSECYWPGPGELKLYGSYLVTGIAEMVNGHASVVERRFRVEYVVDKRMQVTANASPVAARRGGTVPSEDSSIWQTPVRRHDPSGFAASCNGLADDDDDDNFVQHLEPVGSAQVVTQLQYLDWPDQDVPESPDTLLDLCERVDELCSTSESHIGKPTPSIVHCSAGVGRTGTYIAVDKTLRRLRDAFSERAGEATEPVLVEEIHELVKTLKNERSKMVQTPEQYRFIFQAVLAGMDRFEKQGGMLGGEDGKNGVVQVPKSARVETIPPNRAS